MKMLCWRCTKDMKRIEDNFHGFTLPAWKCQACKEVIYDAKDIQPVLQDNKLKFDLKPEGISIEIRA